MSHTPDPRFRIRLDYGDGVVLGPGKAELLERIAGTGSISAAGREMGMSYKRAWQLVEALNSMFRVPLVLSSRGGARGGGAALTEAGEQVLAAYRALENSAKEASSQPLATLRALRPEASARK
ncbi:molybdate transport system regulatory protein [Pseudooceanicola antarcticus]|uniref:Molybdate transport system regulatory protein n=1 Tax=Pseudooceanicola antarcticus TaxID=1247613 RepID=A0A285J429_9RHOB|nr:LysR family transcriptional regulator [Pseudooceanicola antarcticus]PJE29647.1 molybdenum-binding transcriptional regulator [Pseudooceanicola antarcticus]SNY54968.1 molybdate transport system regulatory protein [Pseudooceanicola antarcticus]